MFASLFAIPAHAQQNQNKQAKPSVNQTIGGASTVAPAGTVDAASAPKHPPPPTKEELESPEVKTQNLTPSSSLARDSKVTLSGTVSQINEDNSFTITYSGGVITVRGDGGRPELFDPVSPLALMPGDTVNIVGTVEEGNYARKELSATSINRTGGTQRGYRNPYRGGYNRYNEPVLQIPLTRPNRY